MKVAPRYTLLSLFTLFILFKLLYTYLTLILQKPLPYFNVYLSMNILCINICQRPDWVIVLWTKIAPENNPIWFFESQKRVAPGRSSNDSSNHLISQRVTSLHVPGDSTLLWGLSNTVLLCCGDCSKLKYSLPKPIPLPPPLLLNGSSAEYPLPLLLPWPGRCLPANQPNCCLSWTSLHNNMFQTPGIPCNLERSAVCRIPLSKLTIEWR